MRETYNDKVKSWKRPSEIESDSPSLFGSKGILADGVQQGGLGSCWFLSSCAALAEYPERVKKLFDEAEYPADGQLTLNMFLRGQPIKVRIDDRLPYKDEYSSNGWTYAGSLVNTRKSPNGAYWVPFAEKAMAKLMVDFENLNGGNQFEGMNALTGMPTRTVYHEDIKGADLFDLIKDADERKWMITGSNYQQIDGLPGGHAYTVIGTNLL